MIDGGCPGSSGSRQGRLGSPLLTFDQCGVQPTTSRPPLRNLVAVLALLAVAIRIRTPSIVAVAQVSGPSPRYAASRVATSGAQRSPVGAGSPSPTRVADSEPSPSPFETMIRVCET